MERERIERESQRKRLSVKSRETIRVRIRTIDLQIEKAQREEWDADDERYDLLW